MWPSQGHPSFLRRQESILPPRPPPVGATLVVARSPATRFHPLMWPSQGRLRRASSLRSRRQGHPSFLRRQESIPFPLRALCGESSPPPRMQQNATRRDKGTPFSPPHSHTCGSIVANPSDMRRCPVDDAHEPTYKPPPRRHPRGNGPGNPRPLPRPPFRRLRRRRGGGDGVRLQHVLVPRLGRARDVDVRRVHHAGVRLRPHQERRDDLPQEHRPLLHRRPRLLLHRLQPHVRRHHRRRHRHAGLHAPFVARRGRPPGRR